MSGRLAIICAICIGSGIPPGGMLKAEAVSEAAATEGLIGIDSTSKSGCCCPICVSRSAFGRRRRISGRRRGGRRGRLFLLGHDHWSHRRRCFQCLPFPPAPWS
jgi:hypothetical protein